MNKYEESVLEKAGNGDIDGLRANLSYLCACLGPRDGDELCPCKMRAAATRKLVNCFALTRKGKIVLNPSNKRRAGNERKTRNPHP